ncbi:hypothetical protein [Synechococcus phage Ssp-JY39]|nr:hypothetical protein [Synechococcus phage Yong-M2-251]
MKLFTSLTFSILAASISGCQTSAGLPTESEHHCVITPAGLVECELADDTEMVGGA